MIYEKGELLKHLKQQCCEHAVAYTGTTIHGNCMYTKLFFEVFNSSPFLYIILNVLTEVVPNVKSGHKYKMFLSLFSY